MGSKREEFEGENKESMKERKEHKEQKKTINGIKEGQHNVKKNVRDKQK